MSLSQVNLQQLHSDILDYLTKRSRIMACHNLRTWNEFNAFYNFKYADYSREDLRCEFLETILPKVFTYNLTAIQRRKIEIFASHNGFVGTENGFKIVPRTRVANPTEGVHFSTSKEDAQEHQLSCIVGGFTHEPTPDQKIKAWVSAVNSTEEELVFNRLLPDDELRSRLQDFRKTGSLPPNLSPAIASKIVAYRDKLQLISSRIVPNSKESNQ